MIFSLREINCEDMNVQRWRSSVAVLSVAMVVSTNAIASEPIWPPTAYDYVVVDQDLRTVLTQFGTNTGLRLVLSDQVQGRVHGRLPSASPREFLSNLAQEFGLDWYFDGAVISVSATSEAQTRLLSLQGVSFPKLRDGLAAAGLLEQRFQLKPGLASDIVIISGPPRYVAMVQQATAALSAEKDVKRAPASGETMVVFRGSTVNRVQFP